MLSRRIFVAGSFMTIAGLALGGCGQNEPAVNDAATFSKDTGATDESDAPASAEADTAAAGTVLVAYYSATGCTQAVASTIADKLGADLFEIQPKDSYTDDDLDYNDDSSRVCKEHDDANRAVELAQTTPDGFAGYETVFIGYPIWWGEASWVVDAFVKENDFSGKKVIPFCTSAASGLGESGDLLADMAGTGDWQDGMRFSSSADAGEVEDWVDGLGL